MEINNGQAPAVIDWLLEGDPSIRWQVMKDLLLLPEQQWRAEQKTVACEGWGYRLLSHQAPDGTWAKGIYTPKWTSTTYTLLLLKNIGLEPGHPAALKACEVLDQKNHSVDGGINYWGIKHSETCVTGMILGIFSWFGYLAPATMKLAEYLMDEQMPDGGWNCRRRYGAVHSSFHTTINVLEGLRELEKIKPETRLVTARNRAVEFMLQHRLFRSHRTGKVFDPQMTMLSYPAYWHYDIMRMLDYMADRAYPHDKRMDGALAIIRKKQTKNGLWPLQHPWKAKVWFEMEKPGMPSRWNTLRALRILKIYK